MVSKDLSTTANNTFNLIGTTIFHNFEMFDITGHGNNTLIIDEDQFERLTVLTNLFVIEGDTGDTVDLSQDADGDWTLGLSAFGSNVYYSPNESIIAVISEDVTVIA